MGFISLFSFFLLKKKLFYLFVDVENSMQLYKYSKISYKCLKYIEFDMNK